MKNPTGIRPIKNDRGEIATRIRYEAISLLKKTDEYTHAVTGTKFVLKRIDELPAGTYVVRNSKTVDGFSSVFYNRREIMETLAVDYLITSRFHDAKTPIAYRVWWRDDVKGWLPL